MAGNQKGPKAHQSWLLTKETHIKHEHQ